MPQFTEVEMAKVTEAFKVFDKNGDGHISSDELAKVMRCMGQNPTDGQVAKMIQDIDSSGNGKIEIGEFVNYIQKQGLSTDEEIKEDLCNAFKMFDQDKNGYISATELRRIMTCMGERMTDEECQEMIECADVNKDGLIDYKEFVRVMTSK